jgi:hypothetical protein
VPLKVAREGGTCRICKIPYRVGDPIRLYLTIDGITDAHEGCFAASKTRLVCESCQLELPPDGRCPAHPEVTGVVEVLS